MLFLWPVDDHSVLMVPDDRRNRTTGRSDLRRHRHSMRRRARRHGRTGLAAAARLLKSGHFTNAFDALAFVASRRLLMRPGGTLVAKTLMYRLFGAGTIPASLAASLEREGLLLCDEGIPGSATFLNFRAPGRYSSWRRRWYTALIALSKVRMVALCYGIPIIDVPFEDGRARHMKFSLEGTGTLAVRFDAGLFRDDWSGTLEYRFRTPLASRFLEIIGERIEELSAAANAGPPDRAS